MLLLLHPIFTILLLLLTAINKTTVAAEMVAVGFHVKDVVENFPNLSEGLPA